jgi:hypothetical protein
MALGSEGIFAHRFPDHPVSKLFGKIATQLIDSQD